MCPAHHVLDLKRAAHPEPVVLPQSPQRVDDDLVAELQSVVGAPASALPVPVPQVVDAPDVPELPVAGLAPVQVHPFDTLRHVRPQVPVTVPKRSGPFSLVPWMLIAAAVVGGLLVVSQYGVHLKSKVVKQSQAAIGSVLTARDDLTRLDVGAARDNFATARDQFATAANQLNIFGPALTGLLAQVPGLGSLKAGRNLVEAGRLLADAGVQLGDATSAFSQTSAAASAPGVKGLSFADLFDTLAVALDKASADVASAKKLVGSVSVTDVPDNFQSQFVSLKDQLPRVTDFVTQGNDTVAFLRAFTGTDHPRRYLILFENSSELRPTGGFAGSYGILTVSGGKITDWHADDIYNPDGQIKNLIVPPKQLQAITPSWGMRDAAWWIDWPTSAKKVQQYYQLGGGTVVDGVIAIHPELLANILDVTGPISVPGYDTTITADNFLATLQQQVDDDRPTGTPKRIIVDLAPLLLDKLASLPTQQWVALLQVARQALDDRNILLQFNDNALQQFADARTWSGRVLDPAGDYLMVTATNVAGAKTDAVTDTSVKLESWLDSGTLVHRLTITRSNNGGKTPYAFYNKTNHSFIRVLVPAGATLRGVSGNARPVINPIADYTTATVDPDLAALEATQRNDIQWGAITYQESGHTGFGFWMDIAPSATTTTQVEYAVPVATLTTPYQLYVQRQPGLVVKNFELTLNKPGLMVASSSPQLNEWPDSWRWVGPLDHDLDLTATLR